MHEMDELIESLTSVIRVTTEVESTMKALYALAPHRSQGSDDTGCIRATISREGELIRLDVSSDWQNSIHPQRLGDHVTQAIHAAYSNQLVAIGRSKTAWNTPKVSDSEARRKADELIKEATAGTSFGPTMSVVDSAEQFIKMAESIDRFAEEDDVLGKTCSGAAVTVRKRAGRIVAVHINSEWAQGRRAASIVSEVMQQATKQEPETPGSALLFNSLAAMAVLGREG